MPLFTVKTTGDRFSRCTEQFFLFRRAQERASLFFKIKVGGPLMLAAAAVVLAVTQDWSGPAGLLLVLAAAVLVWYAAGQLQGRSTRAFIRTARSHPVAPEDADTELLLEFDQEGCTLRAPDSLLPGSDQEERQLFSYGDVSGLFVSEDYVLLGSKTAGGACFAKADLTRGTPEALIAFLEEKCGRKAIYHPLNTKHMQALLK